MSISIVRTSIPDVAETVEISIASEDSGNFVKTELQVPEDAIALAVTVTDGGPDGHTRGPRNVNVVVRDPAGQDVSDSTTSLQNGQMCVLVDHPTNGTWVIEVEYGAAAAAEINASSLKRGWKEKLRRGTRWFSCKTCKVALRAFVIATLLHLGPLVAAGIAAKGVVAVLEAIKPSLLTILMQTLTLEGGALPHLFSIILEYIDNPVDRLLERICSWLGFCAQKHAKVRLLNESDSRSVADGVSSAE